jgi:C-terminal processing protease CtpA/Prc
MTGKHLGAAMAVAAGLVLANAQNWASAQNTTDEQREANEQLQNQAEQRTTNEATQRQEQTGGYGSDNREWNDQQRDSQQRDRQQQNDQQWNDEQQRDRQQGESRNRERQSDDRQSDRRWNEQDRDRQSDIRFDRSDRQGLTIVNIGAGTPFYRSGLRQGDVIVSLDGRPLRNEDDFYRWTNRGERVPVVVLRDGERETIYIQYEGERSGSRSYAENTGSYSSQAYLGVRFEMRFRSGAVIADVVPNSPAEQAGLKAGDELVAINGRQVDSPREVTRIIEALQPGERIDIEFSRRMEQQTQAVLAEHPRAMASAQYQQGRQQYDRGVEQSSYDDQGSYGAPDEYGQSDRGTRSERRGGLLRGLRN